MVNRFRRIRREFGVRPIVGLVVLLTGLAGMVLFGAIAFASPWVALVVVVGLVLGFPLRRPIARGVAYYSRAVPGGLFVYGVVLFAGKRLGLGHEGQLLVITATTVVVFDVLFWSLSDPSVVNTRRSEQG